MNISKIDLTRNDNVAINTFDIKKLQTRIVHLGFGAFHRAHQALITDEMLSKTNSDWGICEINLFGGEELITRLREQYHMYSVMEKGSDSNKVKIIKSVIESLHPTLDGCISCLLKMAEPQVAIVSMTITEKGYCSDPTSGKLDINNVLIQHDLKNPNWPKSAIGYIVQALRLRKEHGVKPFTVLACDNIQNNGKVAKSVILDFAKKIDEELYQWIRDNVTFPCTMVDRIVPAATNETLKDIKNVLGTYDPCGIACEPFLQWVIEDDFVNGRPNWDVVSGVTFVEDVIPYEEMKLRMLNGSHSFLAYLGYLGGYEHVSDTMTNANYRAAAYYLMTKIQAPTLNMPKNTDLDEYASLLIERFTNPNLKHQTWQIAMDGSQKLPQRMVESIRYHIKQGTDYSLLSLAIAGWIRYVTGINEDGVLIDVRDPMVDSFNQIITEHGSTVKSVRYFLGLTAIFGSELVNNNEFVEQVETAYSKLVKFGARQSVADVIS